MTSGEPAGIGLDLSVRPAQQAWPAELVVYTDPQPLLTRAASLDPPMHLYKSRPRCIPHPQSADPLAVLPMVVPRQVTSGVLNPANSHYMLETLEAASRGSMQGAVCSLNYQSGA